MDSRLLRNLIRDHADTGMMTDECHEHIAACIEETVTQSGDWIVEIGTYYGNTAAFMARVLQALPTANHRLVTIDCFERATDLQGNGRGIYGRLMDTLARWRVSDMVLVVTDFSQEAWRYLRPGFCFLTLDGSHQYEDVVADLALYVPMLRTGGLVWMHDMHLPYTGPKRALEEALATRDDLTLEAMHETDAILRKVR
jgi:predicted O-methyltransferase YrrM